MTRLMVSVMSGASVIFCIVALTFIARDPLTAGVFMCVALLFSIRSRMEVPQ